jgi:hypothetical protein
VALLGVFATNLTADDFAFASFNSGAFGTIDLNTGVFTSLGSSGRTLAGLAQEGGTVFGTDYHISPSDLFSVNTANGNLTAIGASAVDYDDFGDTPGGLFAVSFSGTPDLYSINATTGAAALIGPTGVPLGGDRALSNNSGTLFFSNAGSLYTINTSTGLATLTGSGGPQLVALLMEDGILYGASGDGHIVTVNTTTGVATDIAAISGAGAAGAVFGLAATVPASASGVPEPATVFLSAMAISALALTGRRLRRK